MRGFGLMLMCVLSSGCTLGNINSIYRSPDITNGASQIVDAKQRFVLTYPDRIEVNSRGEQIHSGYRSCAEPSPDVFSVLAASGELAVDTAKLGFSGSVATNETGASLLKRTTSLQALRDAYFRLCEAYAIGAIDEIDLMIGQRHNQTALIGLLAVEQLTGAVEAPAVVIGGSAAAVSASGLQRMTRMIGELSAREAELKKEIAKYDEVFKAQDKIFKDNENPPAVLAGGAPETAAEKTAREAKRDEAKLLRDAAKDNRDSLAAEKEGVSKAIEGLSKGLENSAATGSTAASSIPIIIDSKSSFGDRTAIANVIQNIVEAMNGNDFGPTICMTYLRKTSPHDLPAKRSGDMTIAIIADYCAQIMETYIEAQKAEMEVRTYGAKMLYETAAEAISKGEYDKAEKALNVIMNAPSLPNMIKSNSDGARADIGRDFKFAFGEGPRILSDDMETSQRLRELLEESLDGE